MARSIEEILDDLERTQGFFYGQDALSIFLDEEGVPRPDTEIDPGTFLDQPERRDDPADAMRYYARVTFDFLIELRPGEFDPRALGVLDEDVPRIRLLIGQFADAWKDRYGLSFANKREMPHVPESPYYPWDLLADDSGD